MCDRQPSPPPCTGILTLRLKPATHAQYLPDLIVPGTITPQPHRKTTGSNNTRTPKMPRPARHQSWQPVYTCPCPCFKQPYIVASCQQEFSSRPFFVCNISTLHTGPPALLHWISHNSLHVPLHLSRAPCSWRLYTIEVYTRLFIVVISNG